MDKTENMLTVLLIDDNQDDLEFYRQLLERAHSGYDYRVLTAETAEEGIELFRSNQVHCTFIDFNMPGQDGLSTAEAIQDSSELKNTPFVILTGEPHQSIQAKAARLGALDYLIKERINSSDALEAAILKTINWAHALNHQSESPNGEHGD